ncbi:MAG: DivIVA domain-containing protein [Actinobacteria bacterium]|nr:DivIVA domain-containing protein [Actinomycetota bacterium]
MQHVDLGAEEVASKEFPVKFRGFDQHEVRAFLAQVAAELAAARERERLQRERLEAAETRAASMVPTDAEIEAALGQEAGRVLHAAREAAQEIRSRAEEQVARLVRDASGEGSRAQQEAESLLARRTEEAEKVAAEITAEAHRKAEAELERAKAEGREMVAEAQAIRERVLKDLARRRRAAHQQLEQLRAGRERLLEAYRVVRTTLDEATSELSVAEVEARAAAETASLRMGSMPETTVEELEAELSAARDLGIAPASTTLVPRGKAHAANGNGGHLSSGVAVAVPASDEPVDDPAPPDRREPPGPVVEAVPALLDPAPSDADDDIDDVDDVVAEAATEAPAEAVEPVAVAMAVDSEPDADADGPLALRAGNRHLGPGGLLAVRVRVAAEEPDAAQQRQRQLALAHQLVLHRVGQQDGHAAGVHEAPRGERRKGQLPPATLRVRRAVDDGLVHSHHPALLTETGDRAYRRLLGHLTT